MFKTTLAGFLFWLAGTVLIRLAGERFLLPGRVGAGLALYAFGFGAMFLLALRLFRWLGVEPVRGVTLLALPTLVLDPLACLFVARLFPNVAPGAAGIFGGWMLICCAGAVAGAWVAERR